MAAIAVHEDAVDASKSPSDQKQYRLLELQNGLQALLISVHATAGLGDGVRASGESDQDDGSSDEEEDEEEEDQEDEDEEEEGDSSEDDDSDIASEHSAFGGDDGDSGGRSRRAGACLSVGVGSFAEPEHLPGLAHYLEHMVFMGSKKYPDENAFEAFLSAHGGFSNGATDNEMTSYTFEVGPAHLQPALDMFAQFFIAPLMKADAMERELAAIESEFNQATQNDRTRLQQFLCDSSPASHPYHRFGWGNFKSLKEIPESKGIDVRAEIRAFYDRYYSAHLMKLVVCGEDSLDDLAAWVTESFSAIPNHAVDRPTFATAGAPFGRGVDASPRVCRVVPMRDMLRLHMDWMLPPILGAHRTKPADYIASLLGHESEGSVLAHLKKRGWILSLTAGVVDSDGYECGTYGAKFNVTMKLTPEGLENWESIVEVVFEYLAMLSASGLPKWVFDELQALAEISFRFQQDTSAVENCEDLAQIMQDMFKVEPCDWLRYDLFLGPFDHNEIQSALSALTPDNVRIMLASRTFAPSEDFQNQSHRDQWFGVQYSIEDIHQDKLDRWNHAGLNAALHLPQPNPFVPRGFDLVPLPSADQAPNEMQSRDARFGRALYKQDDVFRTPRAHVGCFFELPNVLRDVDFLMLTHLFVRVVRDALTARTYQASVAELMYTLQVKQAGVELMFGGFSDKLPTLVKCVLEELFSTRGVDAQRFAVLREEFLRDQRNNLVKPSHKTRYLQNQLLDEHSFPMHKILSALEQTSHAQLENFVSNNLWTSGVRVSTFVHGNLTWTSATSIQRLVEQQLESVKAVPLPRFDPPVQHICALPASNEALLLSEWSEHEKDVNTRVQVHFQVGSGDMTSLAYMHLLEQLMDEPIFDTLRTKQALGYEVSGTMNFAHNVLGFNIAVESSLCTTAHILSCIDNFLVDFARALVAMPDEHFDAHVQAQIQKLREPDHNLVEATQRYWYEIVTHRECFDIDEQIAHVLEQCTQAQMVAYYRQWMLEKPKKLVVFVKGKASVDAQRHEVENGRSDMHSGLVPLESSELEAFKGALPIYPNRWLNLEDHAANSAIGERTTL